MELEKLKFKVKKLFDTAESLISSGNEAAAQNYLAKANELLIKFKIDKAELKGEDEEDYKVSDKIYYGKDNKYGLWEFELANVIGEANLCEVFYNTHRNYQWKRFPWFKIVGKESNVDISIYMIEIAKRIFTEISDVKYNQKCERAREIAVVEAADARVAAFLFEKVFSRNGFDHQVTPDDVMPASYAEKDLESIQNWYLKQGALIKFKFIESRSVFVKAFLRGVVLGLTDKLAKEEKKIFEESPQSRALIKNEMAGVVAYVEMNKTQHNIVTGGSGAKSGLTNINIVTRDNISAVMDGIRTGRKTNLVNGVETGTKKVSQKVLR